MLIWPLLRSTLTNAVQRHVAAGPQPSPFTQPYYLQSRAHAAEYRAFRFPCACVMCGVTYIPHHGIITSHVGRSRLDDPAATGPSTDSWALTPPSLCTSLPVVERAQQQGPAAAGVPLHAQVQGVVREGGAGRRGGGRRGGEGRTGDGKRAVGRCLPVGGRRGLTQGQKPHLAVGYGPAGVNKSAGLRGAVGCVEGAQALSLHLCCYRTGATCLWRCRH